MTVDLIGSLLSAFALIIIGAVTLVVIRAKKQAGKQWSCAVHGTSGVGLSSKLAHASYAAVFKDEYCGQSLEQKKEN